MVQANSLNHVIRHGLQMRKCWDTKVKIAQWFPGHMGKGMTQIQKKLKDIDCILEVHDARIPISGRNPFFQRDLSMIKPNILLLTKVDLIDYNETTKIIKYYKEKGITNVIFANCKEPNSKAIKAIVPNIVKLIKNSQRYNRTEIPSYCVMIIGVPNVGKSSLINALRHLNLNKKRATAVGGTPGITKSVLERIKISLNPLIYVLDTPGILAPKIETPEIGLKLAVVNTIKDHLVGEDLISDYLLYRMNLMGNHSYVEALQLEESTDDIQKLLVNTAVKKNLILKRKSYSAEGGLNLAPDVLSAAKLFLNLYRKGNLGHVNLDL